MAPVHLHLVDTDSEVTEALRSAFHAAPDVEISVGNILDFARNTLVSPANSFGFMDGGIDLAYLDFFGLDMQVRVQEAIARRPEGHLPIGSSLVVETGHYRIPFLIVAPTMLGPEAVPAEHCYRAMRAVLRIAGANEAIGKYVYCPGLGTGVGRVAPTIAAQQMATAYFDWLS